MPNVPPSDPDKLLQVVLQEYNSIKAEQSQRLGFRDNLLYVNLTVYGAVISFVAGSDSHYYALLVLPWVSLILGWTYLVNDEKISAIGRYIRFTLSEKVSAIMDTPAELLFGWETAHRDDRWRMPRKYFQWFIDEVSFCVSGWMAIIIFLRLETKTLDWTLLFFIGIGAFLLLLLAIWIWLYASLIKGREVLKRHAG